MFSTCVSLIQHTNSNLKKVSDFLRPLDPLPDCDVNRKLRVIVGVTLMACGTTLLIIGKRVVQEYYFGEGSTSIIANVFADIMGPVTLIGGACEIGYGLAWTILPNYPKLSPKLNITQGIVEGQDNHTLKIE
jgi:hypothetical protein